MNIKRIIHLILVNMFIVITDKSTFYITTSPLLLSGVTFYFYFFLSQIEPEDYESEKNWFNYEQLEDEE